jgi:prepilin-type N-terminal cleavage/methylation domain-containing protein
VRLLTRDRTPQTRAFSLLELLAVIGIVAIFAALLVSAYSMWYARAQRVQCTANLRSLYLATEAYVQQHESWPQVARSADTTDEEFAAQWIAALEPFGPTRKTWICPTMQNFMGSPDYTTAGSERIDYMPMPFDDKPLTPHQWPQAPWFVEVGDVHGNGNLIIFTDGSISDLKTITSQAAKTQ